MFKLKKFFFFKRTAKQHFFEREREGGEGEGKGEGGERERARDREILVQFRQPSRKKASIDQVTLNKNYVHIILGIFLSILSYNLFDSYG